jgi:hypothetical protein
MQVVRRIRKIEGIDRPRGETHQPPFNGGGFERNVVNTIVEDGPDLRRVESLNLLLRYAAREVATKYGVLVKADLEEPPKTGEQILQRFLRVLRVQAECRRIHKVPEDPATPMQKRPNAKAVRRAPAQLVMQGQTLLCGGVSGK